MEITSLELILKLLQDGKITVSEALQLIQDLQDKGVCGKDDLVLPNRDYVPVLPHPYTNPYVTPYTGTYVTYTTATRNNTKSDGYDYIGNKGYTV